MFNNVLHKIFVNINTGNCQMYPTIVDICQGDSKTHTLMFQLVNDHINPSPSKFISIPDYTDKIKISFVDRDNEVFESEDVQIINKYRGQFSYTITDSITSKYGMYNVYVSFINSHDNIIYQFSFVATVSKNHDYHPESKEIAFTEAIYDEINNRFISDELRISKLEEENTELRELLNEFINGDKRND